MNKTQVTIPSIKSNYFYDPALKEQGIDLKLFRTIMNEFFIILMYDIIHHGSVYGLPYSLGKLGAFKRRTVGRGMFNYQLYKETGIKSYIKNNHSEKLAVNLRWIQYFIPTSPTSGHSNRLFKWRPTRFWKRYLAAYIKDGADIQQYEYNDEKY